MKSQPLDPVIVGEKIKNLGINFKQDFNIFDYIKVVDIPQPFFLFD